MSAKQETLCQAIIEYLSARKLLGAMQSFITIDQYNILELAWQAEFTRFIGQISFEKKTATELDK